jgi:hypothetical protein
MAGMKKFMAVLEFIVGGLLCLGAVSDIPRVIKGFASGNIAYALGSILGTFILGYLGYWLIKHGRKTWDSSLG